MLNQLSSIQFQLVNWGFLVDQTPICLSIHVFFRFTFHVDVRNSWQQPYLTKPKFRSVYFFLHGTPSDLLGLLVYLNRALSGLSWQIQLKTQVWPSSAPACLLSKTSICLKYLHLAYILMADFFYGNSIKSTYPLTLVSLWH